MIAVMSETENTEDLKRSFFAARDLCAAAIRFKKTAEKSGRQDAQTLKALRNMVREAAKLQKNLARDFLKSDASDDAKLLVSRLQCMDDKEKI